MWEKKVFSPQNNNWNDCIRQKAVIVFSLLLYLFHFSAYIFVCIQNKRRAHLVCSCSALTPNGISPVKTFHRSNYIEFFSTLMFMFYILGFHAAFSFSPSRSLASVWIFTKKCKSAIARSRAAIQFPYGFSCISRPLSLFHSQILFLAL